MTTSDDATPPPPAHPPTVGSTEHRSMRRRMADHYEGLGAAGKATVLAALVTAVFALAGTFVTVLVPLWFGSDSSDQAKADNQPTPIVSSPTPAPVNPPVSDSPSASDAPAPAASLPSTSNEIQYTGSVRISRYGPNLDVKPPKISETEQGDVELGLVEPPRINGYDITNPPSLALWSGSSMPTRQQCADLVATQGVSSVEVKKGTKVCLQTDEGRIAVLTITSTSNDFSTGELAQVTVWSEVTEPDS